MTDVTPEHDAAAEATGKAYAAFNGNPAIINEARELLERIRHAALHSRDRVRSGVDGRPAEGMVGP